MSVSELLMSQKRWGRTRCRRVLVSLNVPENKQVGTLTDRQRMALAETLGEGCPAHEPARPREAALTAV